MALSYSGDLSQARATARDNKGDEIVLVNPIEGAQMWTDMMAIPVDSKLSQSVHVLIDFLLRPQIMARISNTVEYANPVPSSWALIDETIRKDPVLFPNADAQKKLYTQYLLTDSIQKIQERIWRGTKKE
jgi:putrescine transport system substrate-binding protein